VTAPQALGLLEALLLASLMREPDCTLSPGRDAHTPTALATARRLARKGFAELDETTPGGWVLTAAPGPIRLRHAREVRALLVDAGFMPAHRFDFAYRAVLDHGYCPFWFGERNYCLGVTRDRSEWQIADVTEPSPAEG